MIDYIVSLREGIMDAWGGIIIAVRSSQKRKKLISHQLITISLTSFEEQLIQPYVDSIFQLLQSVYQDPNRTEALLRSSMGVVGYVNPLEFGGLQLTIL
jgi:importin subunit beta-1